MSITRIQNNQITDSTIVAYAKIQNGSLTGNLFAPNVTLNSNVTINGGLFLANTGNTIIMNATNTYINDPIVTFNNGYAGSLTGYDIGMLVNRNLTALATYGSVNTAWVWSEADGAFISIATTDTGAGVTSINNSGYANIKVGNSVVVGDQTIGGRLTVTGNGAFNNLTGASFQGVIGNVTPSSGAFTTVNAGSGLTASSVQAATIGNAAASGQFGTVTATTVNAATLGNTGAAHVGATVTITGLVTANALNAATIGNASASGQFGTVTATTVNAATIGNASASGQFGTVTATTVNAATIGNTGASLTGATLTTSSSASIGTTLTATTVNAATIGNASASGQFGTVTATTLNAATIGNAAASGQFGTVTATTLNAATIGNASAVIAGASATLTGLLTASSVNAATIGNASASGQFGTVTATTLNAATIGNASAVLAGASATLTGLLTASTVNAATIGNASASGQFGTVTATTLNAATIGNTGAVLIGTLSASNIVGTATTANVAIYEQIIPLSNNQTYYLPFANVTNGNSTLGAVSGVNVNPSTSTINALAFAGGTGTFTVANITNNTNNTGAGTGAFQVAGGAYIAGNLWVGGNINAQVSAVAANNGLFYGNAAGFGALYAGITSGFVVQAQTVLQNSTNFNGYAQVNHQNINGGSLASGDYIVTANNGTANDTYIDLGMASSAYNYPGFGLIKPNDGYVLVQGNATTGGGNLVLTSGLNDIVFAPGGSNANNEFGRMTAGNVFIIKSTTQATGLNTGAVQIAGGLSVGANVYIGGNLSVNGTLTYLNTSVTQLTGSEIVAGTLLANSGAASSSTTTGALQVLGGAGITGAIYAGSIQNTPIGGTTASTGAFTTLNAANGLTASSVSAATIGNASASLSGATVTITGLVTANALNAATIGNAGATLSGATTTLTGLLTASSVNAATIGNAAASGQFGTITATTVNAATIGNAGASLVGGSVTTTGLVTANALNAATIGNASAVISGASATLTGLLTASSVNAATIGNASASGQFGTVTATTLNAATIGNASASGQFGTVTATTVNAATIGNTGATLIGGGASITSLTGANVVGTVGTANVAIYEQLTNSTTNATFYPSFYDKATGNAIAYTNTSVNVNPSTGNVYATAFVGSGAYLTNITVGSIGTVPTANVSLYDQVAATTTNATFYPTLVDKATGNVSNYTNSSLTYNPSTGALSATSFNGIGTFSTATTSSTFQASGQVTAAAAISTTNNSTGALVVSNGGAAVTGNVNIGSQLFVGAAAQASAVAFNSVMAGRGTSTSGAGTQYAQIALVNATNTGSTDFAGYPNNTLSDLSHGWVDVGITGDAFNDPAFTITSKNDSYLFGSAANATVGGNLVLATDYTGSYNDIVIGTGSFFANAEVARFHGNASNSGTFVLKLPTNASPAANTGAFQVWGGASFSSNVYHGGATILNGSKTAGYDTIVKGKNDDTLIWARPNATYDTVIIGNSATASTVVTGAKLQINTTDAILLPVGTNAQRPSSAYSVSDVAGMFRYNSTSGAIEWYNGSSWQSASSNFTVITDEQFNGTGSQTNFTLAAGTTTASTIVSINGVLQIPTLAYSITGGSSNILTFTEAPASGDVIDVRRLTTTSTVTGLSDTSGYNTVNVITGTGVTFTTGLAAQTTQYTIDTNGGFVTNGSNVTVASAGTSVVDNLFANSYSSAKYTITATLQGTNIREISEVLMVHSGGAAGAGTATVAVYGRVNTAGNTLVTWGATTSGNIAQLQATTTNANTILRIKRDYMAI